MAWADGALIGAETLRRHGSTCLIHAPDLLSRRAQERRSPQPIAVVVSRTGAFAPSLPFFAQPLDRWLLLAAPCWREGPRPPGFARCLPLAGWEATLQALAASGLRRLVVLGGAALAGSLLAEGRMDELQLTLCPLLLGGGHTWLAPDLSPAAGLGTGWRLLEHRSLGGEELLLHYGRTDRGEGSPEEPSLAGGA